MTSRKDILLVAKQIWYIPFFWSLAWFSYWIGYSFFVYNQTLSQINPEYYYGMTISVAAILIARYVSGKSKSTVKKTKVASSVEKEFSLRNSLNEGNGQSQFFNHDVKDRPEMEAVGQKPHINQQSLIETFQLERPWRKPWERSEEQPQERATIPATTPTPSNQVKQHDQPCKPPETSSDCFVCPNLMNCTQRQKRVNNSNTPCPFTKKNQQESPSKS